MCTLQILKEDYESDNYDDIKENKIVFKLYPENRSSMIRKYHSVNHQLHKEN